MISFDDTWILLEVGFLDDSCGLNSFVAIACESGDAVNLMML